MAVGSTWMVDWEDDPGTDPVQSVGVLIVCRVMLRIAYTKTPMVLLTLDGQYSQRD